MKKLLTAVKGLLKGAVKGGAETTLIPSVIREIGKLKKARDAYKYGGEVDLNGAKKINIKTLFLMEWETVGKIAAIALVLYFAVKYKFEDELIYVLQVLESVIK